MYIFFYTKCEVSFDICGNQREIFLGLIVFLNCFLQKEIFLKFRVP